MVNVVNLIKVGLTGVLLLFFLGFWLGTSVVAPEHAIVLIDSDKGVYLAPQCILEIQTGLTKTTIGDARKAGVKPDPTCRDAGAFTQDVRSPSGMLLEKIGILDSLKPRWNKDASWNIKPGVASLTLNETPKPMLKNVHALTEASAVLQICFQSSAYKALSDKKALELHGLLIRVGDLIQVIGKHYNDDALYMTPEMSKVKMSSDPQLKEYAKDNYHFCDEKLFSGMDRYITDNEKIINDFLDLGACIPCGPEYPHSNLYVQWTPREVSSYFASNMPGPSDVVRYG